MTSSNKTTSHLTPTTRAVYLMRHGAVEGAKAPRRYIGQTDLVLSAAGRRQCDKWKGILDSVAFETIICSDLRRSVETAALIAGHRAVDIRTEPALREIYLGAWEGLTFESIKKRYPQEFDRRGQSIATHRPPDGESFADLAQRVLPVFHNLAAQSTGPMLVVGHGGVNRVILSHLLEMPLEAIFLLGQDYAAMNLLIPYRNTFRVQGLNIQLESIEDFFALAATA